MVARTKSETDTRVADTEVQADLGINLPPRWRAVRELGRGGQGVVWLAYDNELQEPVAIKVVHRSNDRSSAERFRREVAIGRRLRHKNIVQVYELIEAGDRLAVVMEYLSPGSLSRTRDGARSPFREVLKVATDVLAGLQYLNGQGIVHRDVKPSNILRDQSGRYRLADLGTLQAPSEGAEKLTRTGITVGTPAYMSPEQIRGERPGPASDIFSLGVTLYQLLTGRLPFDGDSDLEIASKVLNESPVPVDLIVPNCPKWFVRWVSRALEKGNNRWRDAAEAQRALRKQRVGIRPSSMQALLSSVAVTTLLSIAVIISFGWKHDRDPVSILAQGNELIARNSEGREIWRRTMRAQVSEIVRSNTFPSSGLEANIVEFDDGPDSASASLVCLDAHGEELNRTALSGHQVLASMKGFSNRFEASIAATRDLDGDGYDELVWVMWHRVYYPSALGIWSPAHNSNQTLMINSGHIRSVTVAQLDDDPDLEIVATGLSNPLGEQLIAAIFGQDGKSWSSRFSTSFAPDLLKPMNHQITGNSPLRAFVPLGEYSGEPTIRRADSLGIRITTEGGNEYLLDRDGNPLSSALAGTGPNKRKHYWHDIVVDSAQLESGSRSISEVITQLRQDNKEAWSEQPTRDAGYLALACGLALANKQLAAADLLTRLDRGDATPRRVHRQIGNLLLVAGQQTRARRALEYSLRIGGPGLPSIDSVIPLAVDAAATGNKRGFEQALMQLSSSLDIGGEDARENIESFVAFLQGDWSVPRESPDPRFQSGLYPKLLCRWARMEKDRQPQGLWDVVIQSGVEQDIADIVRARSLYLQHDIDGAWGTIRPCLSHLEFRARKNYLDAVWYALANWVAGNILAERDPELAIQCFDVTIRYLPETWFGKTARQSQSKLSRN